MQFSYLFSINFIIFIYFIHSPHCNTIESIYDRLNYINESMQQGGLLRASLGPK